MIWLHVSTSCRCARASRWPPPPQPPGLLVRGAPQTSAGGVCGKSSGFGAVAVVQKNQNIGHELEETEENMGRGERISLELQEYYSATTCIVMVVMLHL